MTVVQGMRSAVAFLLLGSLRAWAGAFQFHLPGKIEFICGRGNESVADGGNRLRTPNIFQLMA